MAGRFGIKLLLVLLLVAFGVFYGVDLATRGMERVYGPLPGAELTIEEEATGETEVGVDSDLSAVVDDEQLAAQQAAETREEPIPYNPRSPKITEMIGTSLQKVAQGVVDTVVSVFELFL